jgi:mono/diheme cytochrome c family protein/glucose/arabinose dehydrogenase
MISLLYSLQVLIATLFLSLVTYTSDPHATSHRDDDSLVLRKSVPPSPVLSPQESLSHMKAEDGFEIKLVAAEPLVVAPIAMNFDEKGRMWVLEMQGYMPDTMGHGEDQPIGKVVILEDKNNDGIVDERKIFLDSLVMPRALCLVDNGLLVAEPPNLWYVSNKNDVHGKKVLIDAAYTEGGNVEHWPNGLYRDLDNWIYSANSRKRYRKVGEKWLTEKTFDRGQWGISQDDAGRLFYNNNSFNLLGDYFPPQLGAANANQKRVAGFNERVVSDNHVFPARPTPGVNRGYLKGTLDDSLRLVEFTAASGPVIYRGNLFGDDYQGNAFVGEPSANLIKRDILEDNGNKVSGKQAYKGREFVASTDERFRPVTLYNGPDGALYVIDMYRGIIQHKTYLTPYLKNEIRIRELTQPLSCGRIYKVIPKNKTVTAVKFPANPNDLAKLLLDPNGWVRDKAQQLLIDRKAIAAIPVLRQFLKGTDKPLTVIHALWTLEGLGALKPDDISPLLASNSAWTVRMQALTVLPSVINKKTYVQYAAVMKEVSSMKDSLSAPYIAFLAQTIQPVDKAMANRLLLNVIKVYPHNMYVADAAISSLYNKEGDFLKELVANKSDTNSAVYKRLKLVAFDVNKSKTGSDSKLVAKEFPKGSALFKSTCQTCHGPDGGGIKSLAPPLNSSEWVNGDKNKLIPLVLFGLSGPVKVNGTVYKAPDYNGEMPGMGYNTELPDEDIAQVISFIRSSWNNNAPKITAKEVTAVRQKFKGRQKAFTIDELNKTK